MSIHADIKVGDKVKFLTYSDAPDYKETDEGYVLEIYPPDEYVDYNSYLIKPTKMAFVHSEIRRSETELIFE